MSSSPLLCDLSLFTNYQRHDRYGVLWAERFKSVLLKGGEALAAVAGKPKLCQVTLRQAQAKARLQTPPDCDVFNRFGVSGPLGLPRSTGASGRLGSCRFRLPSNVTRSDLAIFRISGVVSLPKRSGTRRKRSTPWFSLTNPTLAPRFRQQTSIVKRVCLPVLP